MEDGGRFARRGSSPSRSLALVAVPGAVVVFFGVALGGVLLITRTSLRTMAARTGRGVGSVARPSAARPATRCASCRR